jgi:hypothetical protein
MRRLGVPTQFLEARPIPETLILSMPGGPRREALSRGELELAFGQAAPKHGAPACQLRSWLGPLFYLTLGD